MEFQGYLRKGPVGRRGVALIAAFGLALFVLWLGVAFVPMPSGVGRGLLVLWFVASGWGTVRLERPRGQRGHGTLADDTVTWEGTERLVGHLIKRSDVALANAWGPRVVYPVLVVLWVWVGAHGHGVFRQPSTTAFGALALLLAWQSWLRPAYRTELTVATETGRRRIRVVRMEEARRAVPS